MELQKEWSTSEHSFIVRVNIKNETEIYISTKNNSLQKQIVKWTL